MGQLVEILIHALASTGGLTLGYFIYRELRKMHFTIKRRHNHHH